MSMHYHMPDQANSADSWKLFCPECSQKMRIIIATPTQDEKETRTYECVYGSSGTGYRGPSLTRRPRQLMTACSDWPHGMRILPQHCLSARLPLHSLGNSIASHRALQSSKKIPRLNRGDKDLTEL